MGSLTWGCHWGCHWLEVEILQLLIQQLNILLKNAFCFNTFMFYYFYRRKTLYDIFKRSLHGKCCLWTTLVWFWLTIAHVHYDDVIMTMLASQITSLTVVYSIVYSDVNQRKHQSSASLAFVREIHRGPVNFPHKWPVTRQMFPFDDVIMFLHVSATPKPRCATPCYIIFTLAVRCCYVLYVAGNVPEFWTSSKFRYVKNPG